MEPATSDGETEVTHEVWALSGGTAIANRTRQLIDGATEEVVLVVGHEHLVTDELIETLRSAQEQDVTVVVGAITESLRERVQSALPDAEVFVSEPEWLSKSALAGDETEIGRLLLVDRTTILVSTFTSHGSGSRGHEQAVFGDGFDNGLVAIVRRLMATGLLQADGASETRDGPDLA
jgi:sugar-specific transcriptional regulator TrmB